jgi:hypothetical protein
MNKVVEELAIKSGFSETYGLQEKERLNKFAELIVNECSFLVENQGKFLRYDGMAAKLKQHFGVK